MSVSSLKIVIIDCRPPFKATYLKKFPLVIVFLIWIYFLISESKIQRW